MPVYHVIDGTPCYISEELLVGKLGEALDLFTRHGLLSVAEKISDQENGLRRLSRSSFSENISLRSMI